MEQLPNKLWFFTFRYLHKIEILYSFNNLNKRIQDMIIPYAYHIDLTNVSSKLFRIFSQYVFHHQIQSLFINISYEQFQLSKRCFLSLGKSLKSLTIIINPVNDNTTVDEYIDFYPDQLHYFKQLTDIYIYDCYLLSNRLAKIAKHATSTLTNLILICSLFFSKNTDNYIDLNPNRLTNLTSLTINSAHEKYLLYLSRESLYLNLEELWHTIIFSRYNLVANTFELMANNISVCSNSNTINFNEQTKKNMLDTVFRNLYTFISAVIEEKTGNINRTLQYYQEHIIRSGQDYKIKIVYRYPTSHYQYVAFIFKQHSKSLHIDSILKILKLNDDVVYIPKSRTSICAFIKTLNDINTHSLEILQNYIRHDLRTYYFQTSFNIIDLLQIMVNYFENYKVALRLH